MSPGCHINTYPHMFFHLYLTTAPLCLRGLLDPAFKMHVYFCICGIFLDPQNSWLHWQNMWTGLYTYQAACLSDIERGTISHLVALMLQIPGAKDALAEEDVEQAQLHRIDVEAGNMQVGAWQRSPLCKLV